MTVRQACQKWGCSQAPIIRRLRAGQIPGAKMVQYAPKTRRRWFIPDDTPRPELDVRCRTVQPKPKGIGTSSVDYVWNNQNSAIGELAKALGITNAEVVALYEQACRKYLHGKTP